MKKIDEDEEDDGNLAGLEDDEENEQKLLETMYNNLTKDKSNEEKLKS